MSGKNAIIVGASSGLGRELAGILSENGYTLGLAARRVGLLNELQAKIPGESFVKRIDVSDAPEAMRLFKELIDEMGSVNLVVLSAGIGFTNKEIDDWEPCRQTIDVNVSGFVALSGVAMEHFMTQKSGHLVGISSIAALRGGREAPVYNASKAFVSNYLQGLRQFVVKHKHPITITNIQSGLVNTAMAKGEGLFWLQPAEKAARQIFSAIRKKRNRAYITRRWRLIAWLLKILPDWIYNRL